MAEQDNDDLGEAIEAAAGKPRQVTVDGVVVQAHSLPDLIAADKHLANKRAAKKGGMRIQKIIPPGTA